MMQHYDRSTIIEEPVPRCQQCKLKPCEICVYQSPHVVIRQKPRVPAVIDADTIQAEQREHRFSLRRLK